MCIPSSIIASRKMYAPPYRYSRFPGKREGWISEKMDPTISVGWSVSSISLKIGKLTWRNISGQLSSWNHFRRKICTDCSTSWDHINLSNKNNSIKYRCICKKHLAVMSSQWEALTKLYFFIGMWDVGCVCVCVWGGGAWACTPCNPKTWGILVKGNASWYPCQTYR